MNSSSALMEQLQSNKSEFWSRLITIDETWIHHYTLETKIQSKQWTVIGESLKVVFSAGEKAVTVI